MEPQVTLFELILTAGGSGVAIVGAWIHMRISVANLNTELKYLKETFKEEKDSNKEIQKEISGKLDTIFKILSELKVSIAEKA